MITIGLVVEGAHDFLMLSPLITREIAKKTSEPVQFEKLQPAPDSTGNLTDGGWTRVAAWCQAYSGAKIETFLTPLFAGTASCDAIVIHLDGDALEELGTHTKVIIPQPVASKADRIKLITEVVEGWLNLTAINRSKVAVAAPVLHTEVWIVAAEGKSKADAEAINAKADFRSAYNYRSRIPLARYYKQKVEQVLAVSRVPAICISYSAFVTEIDGLNISTTIADGA